jgi:hypothetical protein
MPGFGALQGGGGISGASDQADLRPPTEPRDRGEARQGTKVRSFSVPLGVGHSTGVSRTNQAQQEQ